ncbi:MAG: valine--tRNA ligase [Phycisphaerae bacterium]|nr:valine--tRNA ligase [Phycisphaerae bacterium]
MPKSYAPSDVEGEILIRWAEANVGHCDGSAEGTPFSVLIPPPNVTAPLHLGHALNNTLQDVLVRWHRMKGNATLWMPGTDHAGIATQTVVEKRILQQEGKKRTDFTRDEFISRVKAWKDEYESTILSQLRSIGASCDWDRTRFTMDDVCASAVREAFFTLFKDGLIYRGKRLVNWDPVTLTALADDEVEMKEVAGRMYYLKYPLEDGSGHVTVATTRPETMLGDTAVAVNPNDPRAQELRGKFIKLPIVGRIIPIVEDDYVVMQGSDDPKAEYATGFLKVTPAHDPNDWDIGVRHGLEVINVMAIDGSISESYGWEDANDECKTFIGLSREDARDAIILWFKEHELLEEIREYAHSVGHSYRSHVPIEPYLSDQWYVRVTDDRLCNEALRALSDEQYKGTAPIRHSGTRTGDGGMRFFPERYAHSYQAWHENLRDWCISRQLWWGHQIPVWVKSFPDGEEVSYPFEGESYITSSQEFDEGERVTNVYLCVQGGHEEVEQALEADGFSRDEDVLDTWFSSALWPISTMGWPEPEAFPETVGLLEKFNPSSVLCTGRDIITLWVSRMVMFNRYFCKGTLPFSDVYINPMIQDGFGQRMSKSLGNGVDPRDIISTHGADAMRYTLVQLATGSQDVRLGVDLICPYSGIIFTPSYVKSLTGHEVMAPIQSSPEDEVKKISTLYGLLIGEVENCEETPLAVNSSSRFDVGRNFANKYWNANRFALMNVSKPAEHVSIDELTSVDQWMLSRVDSSILKLNDALSKYQFSAASEAMYDLLWRDFCDWYLEAIKPTIKESPAQQRVLHTVLDAICRMLHPICPFVTEAIWPHVHSISSGTIEGVSLTKSRLVASAQWPSFDGLSLDAEEISSFEKARELVVAIRAARASQNVKPKRKIGLLAPPNTSVLAKRHETVVTSLAGLSSIADADDASNGFAVPFDGETLLLTNMFDAQDVAANTGKLQEEIASLEKQVAGFKGRLSNDSYINNAPDHVVQETRDMLAKAEQDLSVAKESL